MASSEKPADDSSQDTQWSLYVDAAHAPGPQLNRLLEAYRQRLINHARRHWGNLLGSDLEDVIQSFFTKFLEGNIVRHARRERGRFRDFLRRCFDNWVKDHLRGKRMSSLQDSQIIDSDLLKPSDFEHMWCEEVLLESAIVAKQHCAHHGRTDIWMLIQDQTLSPILEGTDRLSHADLMQKYGFATENVAAGKVRTAKKWFDMALKEVIKQYAADENVDQELDEFFRLLPAAMRNAGGFATRHHGIAREMLEDLKRHDAQSWNEWFSEASEDERQLLTYGDAFCSEASSVGLLSLIKNFAKKEARSEEGAITAAAATQLYLLAIATARLKHGDMTALSSFSNDQLIERIETCVATSVDPAATELLNDSARRLRRLDS